MTPYVLNEDDSDVAQKPKSIMVSSPNGQLNGDAVKPNGDIVETPDSLPSRSSVSGKSIIGNGKNGKSGALKRVSFGSSKGSMVETLVYDHLEDLPLSLPPLILQDSQALPPFATAPLLNGEDSRLHPAKVRVKFFESQPVAQVVAPLPPLSSSTLSSPDVTLDLSIDTAMTSPMSDSNYARQISAESGVDNPFRPDGELSREADTIVSLIKEGKPITPIKSDADGDIPDGNPAVVANGRQQPATDSLANEDVVVATDASAAKLEASKKPQQVGANGTTTANNCPVGVVEVQHGIIAPPSDAPPVEQVNIKKKGKCKCCVIQ